MKQNVIISIMMILIFYGTSFSQISGNDLPNSIAIQPPNMITSPAGTFSNPVTINGFDNFNLGVDFGEPHIATNPRDPLNSICAFNINNYYYTLNGYDWTKINVVFPGFAVIGDPVMAFDSLGNAYYTQLYQNGATYGVCISKSTNKGVNWTSTYSVYSTNVGLSDKEWIAADQTAGPNSNNLYACWRQFGASGMRFTRSTDLGASWSSVQSFTGGQGAYVAVGPNGNVQGGSVYFAATNGGAIIVNRSTDGGVSFSPQTVATSYVTGGVFCAGRNTVKNCIRMDGFPRMAADNSYTASRGNVYIVYARNPGTQDITDINMVKSTDFGATWSAPVRVNDDQTTTDQWMPAISVDSKTGRVYIAWYDSREDPVNNIMTKIYGTVSTNGGLTFTANKAISNADFNPNNMGVNQPGGERYIGDYFGIQAINNSSYLVWMDGRNNQLGSFTGYYPDFGMTIDKNYINAGNNDNASVVIKVPAVNGPYVGGVKFSASLETPPASGSITFSFLNGKDSVNVFPDSVTLIASTSGNVTPGGYKIKIVGTGTQGPPVHLRTSTILVNASVLTVGTNRPGIANFTVNGVSYNQQQELIYPNGTNVNVQAISPRTIGSTQYVFTNWSNGGDTAQTVTINSNLNLTAFYKVQYRLILTSTQGTTFGGNIYYDSGSSATFGVNSRIVNNGGTVYYFRGWTGTGAGSYTSPDSTGIDSVVSVNVIAPLVETARWATTVGISSIGTEVPAEYSLKQNYPNPFNPSTIINFSIPKSGMIKLRIYDITGKEIAALVNEFKQAGNYSYSFNPVNLNSGIYFYKLESEGFTDIKKMTFIK
ncbi:MAG: T9SS type A sorting domain-containing protein [Ignavibacteria bacterium]|nr:T9SS type A sorting domain-containing protein [Ignavibacteria bacterium]